MTNEYKKDEGESDNCSKPELDALERELAKGVSKRTAQAEAFKTNKDKKQY
jgi:hypothetical protein